MPCAFLEQKLYKESILCNQICSTFPGPSYIITRKATNIPKLHPNCNTKMHFFFFALTLGFPQKGDHLILRRTTVNFASHEKNLGRPAGDRWWPDKWLASGQPFPVPWPFTCVSAISVSEQFYLATYVNFTDSSLARMHRVDINCCLRRHGDISKFWRSEESPILRWILLGHPVYCYYVRTA